MTRRPPDDGRRRAAVAAVLDDDARVLLMKRTERPGDPWSGHISLPGGRYDRRDDDLLATSIRETREELGIDLGGAQLLGNLATLSPLSAGPNGIEVTPFVFATHEPVVPQLSAAEAAAAFWLPIETAMSGALDDVYIYPGPKMEGPGPAPGINREFPSWRFEGHVIWGLTFRILADLVALTK